MCKYNDYMSNKCAFIIDIDSAYLSIVGNLNAFETSVFGCVLLIYVHLPLLINDSPVNNHTPVSL